MSSLAPSGKGINLYHIDGVPYRPGLLRIRHAYTAFGAISLLAVFDTDCFSLGRWEKGEKPIVRENLASRAINFTGFF